MARANTLNTMSQIVVCIALSVMASSSAFAAETSETARAQTYAYHEVSRGLNGIEVRSSLYGEGKESSRTVTQATDAGDGVSLPFLDEALYHRMVVERTLHYVPDPRLQLAITPRGSETRKITRSVDRRLDYVQKRARRVRGERFDFHVPLDSDMVQSGVLPGTLSHRLGFTAWLIGALALAMGGALVFGFRHLKKREEEEEVERILAEA